MENRLIGLTGIERVMLLRELCYSTANIDFKSSIKYGNEALELAIELDDLSLVGGGYKDLANTYMRANQFETAIDLNRRSLEIFNSISDKKELAGVLNNLGSVYRRKGDFTKALEYYFESLKLKDSLGGLNLASAYGNIGHVYRQKGEPEKALEYFFKSLKIEKSENNFEGMAIDYSNIGTAYENAGNYQLAIEYANKALALDRELEDGYGIAIDFNNLGEAYYGMNDYVKAKSYFHSSLQLKKEIGNSNGIAHTSQRLASLFTDTKEYDSALFYAKNSLEVVSRNGNKERRMKNYQVLSAIYEAKGEPSKALNYYRKYEALKDTLYNKEKELLATDMESKYQSAEKDNTISYQQATIAQQQQMQLLYLALGLLLLLGLVGLYLFYRKRQAQNKVLNILNKELDKRNQQNELLLREIHHRVKNNLEMVKSLISLQSAQLEDSPTKEAMMASQNRVQSMGIIHQKLYQGDNLASIEMKDYFINLSEGILDGFKAEDRVKIECAMEELELDVDTAVPLGLIVNELLTNAIKYAFPGRRDGKISVSLKKKEDALTLAVTDNGVGKSTDLPTQGTGFGSQLVRLLTAQLNGEMTEENKEGTTVLFKFKLIQAA